MLAIAIDGACRRNGKPDCISAGGVFVLHLDEDLVVTSTVTISNYELNSTNQRGELLGLLTALEYVKEQDQEAQIVTDSEYIYNAVTKGWVSNWSIKDWITAANEPVKNKDLWCKINALITSMNNEVTFYHIKGHTIPFGKVTATRLLNQDPSGLTLYSQVYDKLKTTQLKEGMYEQIKELSLKNHGYKVPDHVLGRFVVTNTVADAVATKCVEAANATL